MKERILESYQAIAICVTVMLAHIILNLPNHLINSTGSSTIFNLVYIFAIILFLCYLVTKYFKLFPNSDLIDICEYTGGKIAKIIYTIMLFVYLLTISSFVIRIFAESLISIYLPNIDLKMIILIFILITAIMNLLGFKAISRVSAILLPIILFTIIVVFIYSVSAFVPEKALPLLGYGVFDTFGKGLENIFAFSSALILTMIVPLISDIKRLRKIGYISLSIYGVCVIIGTASLLFLIPYVR